MVKIYLKKSAVISSWSRAVILSTWRKLIIKTILQQKQELHAYTVLCSDFLFSFSANSILKREKRLRTRRVHFENVTVYYFSRRQGFTSVPSQGGSTLGMSSRHSWIRQYSVGEFALEQKRIHRDMLRDHLKEEKLNSIKLKVKAFLFVSEQNPTCKSFFLLWISWPTFSRCHCLWWIFPEWFIVSNKPDCWCWCLAYYLCLNIFSFLFLKLTKNGTVESEEANTLTAEDISDDDIDLDNTEVDEYFFLQPLTTKKRRALLRSSGVKKIDVEEKHELRAIRMSREDCGCDCRVFCDPETCACSIAGIKCQVNPMTRML